MEKKITICVPLKYSAFEDVVNNAKEAMSKGADMVEIWFDGLPFTHHKSLKDQKLINELFSLIDLPIICVNKTAAEMGSFEGSEEERIHLLCKAVIAGVDFVDIGIHTSKELMQNLQNVIEENGSMTQLIISYHDFNGTKSVEELTEVVNKAIELGADIIKIATFATEDTDNDIIFEILDLINNKGKKAIVMCMGEKGVRSRLEGCSHGSLWSYAALDEASKTAPGQLFINEMNE